MSQIGYKRLLPRTVFASAHTGSGACSAANAKHQRANRLRLAGAPILPLPDRTDSSENRLFLDRHEVMTPCDKPNPSSRCSAATSFVDLNDTDGAALRRRIRTTCRMSMVAGDGCAYQTSCGHSPAWNMRVTL